jgi:hypothetical protein
MFALFNADDSHCRIPPAIQELPPPWATSGGAHVTLGQALGRSNNDASFQHPVGSDTTDGPVPGCTTNASSGPAVEPREVDTTDGHAQAAAAGTPDTSLIDTISRTPLSTDDVHRQLEVGLRLHMSDRQGGLSRWGL